VIDDRFERLVNAGQFGPARALARTAVDSEPASARWLARLGALECLLGLNARGAACFRGAAVAAPDVAAAWIGLANATLRPDPARRALRIDEGLDSAWTALARWRGDEDSVRRALCRRPDDARLLLQRAAQRGQLTDWRRALRGAGSDVALLSALVEAFVDAGAADEIASAIDALPATFDGSLGARYAAAVATNCDRGPGIPARPRIVPRRSEAVRVAVPWRVPGQPNGCHPLLMPLLDDVPDDLRLELLAPCAAGGRQRRLRAVEEARAFARAADGSLERGHLRRFLAGRGGVALAGEDHDLVFLHTTPLSFGTRPFVLHVESAGTLFAPDAHLVSRDDLNDQPEYRLVRHLLTGPACRRIITHMRATAAGLPALFEAPGLADKVDYCPLGVTAAPDTVVKGKWATVEAGGPLEFLFTGSFVDSETAFHLRGGSDAAAAFLDVAERHADVRLTIRAALPASLDPPLARRLRAHPRVRLVEHPVEDREIEAMFTRAHVFLLPAFTLNSVSLLRAMAHGAVPVVADAWGVDEFVAGGATGVAITGRHGLGGDPRRGLSWIDAAVIPASQDGPPDMSFHQRLRDRLADLCGDRASLARLASRAYAHARDHHDLQRFRAACFDSLRQAARRS
jgi:glycosyltransferase involved in cell wall biosynthesis